MEKIFLDRHPLITRKTWNIRRRAHCLQINILEVIEPVIPRREPKYEIILEEENEINLIKEVEEPMTRRPKNNQKLGQQLNEKKTTEMVTIKPAKDKRKYYGLLGSRGSYHTLPSTLFIIVTSLIIFFYWTDLEIFPIQPLTFKTISILLLINQMNKWNQ